MVSSKLPNILLPHLARAHVMKVWWFVLYLLKCWSFCYQTWFGGALILWRNWVAVFQIKVTAKFQNINKCLPRCYLLNHQTFYITWCCDASLCARVSFKKIELLSSDLFAIFKVKVTVKDHIIKIWLSNISSELLVLLQLNLVWWHIIISLVALWKKLDCLVVVKVRLTRKFQNLSECSSGWYLLNFWIYCNQTWCVDASSWARVSYKKICLLSSRSRSQWGLIWSDMTFCHIH